MTTSTAAEEGKRRMLAGFNAIAGNYDEMRFVQVCAAQLLELANLAPGARVLDVATGTGLVAMVAADTVGSTGSVVGVDVSPDMLAQARQKLAAFGTSKITFQEGDAQRLDFPDASFDMVLCASSLFFMPNMAGAVREWARVVAPGGRVGFSSFGASFLEPLQTLWAERLRKHGVPAGMPPTQRLADPELNRRLLSDAGLTQIDVRTEQVGYYLPSAEGRWREIVVGMEGLPLNQLSPDRREQVQTEHLAELSALATEQGIWVDVPAHFAFGRKPS